MASKRLKKDIVIPAGTVFENVVGMNVEYGNGNYECTIGLTKDSAGSLVYGIGPGDKLLDEWFENCD